MNLCFRPWLLLLIPTLLATSAHAKAPEKGVPTGQRVVIELELPEAYKDPAFRAALQADAAGEHRQGMTHYARAQRRGQCNPGSRCAWHWRLSREILGQTQEVVAAPQRALHRNNLAISYANKLMALRRDLGKLSSVVSKKALRAYRMARDMAEPNQRSDILLGLASLHAELGEQGIARYLFAEIQLKGLQSSTELGNLAYFYTTVGELDLAFEALEKALAKDDKKGSYRTWALHSDDYHRVRHDPRFKKLMQLY